MPEIQFVPGNNRNNDALFGKYELGRLLGCGAFAKVYYARNIHTGQGVAIKAISKKKIPATSSLMANIKREISIMSRLRHPYIVKLHEVLATKTKIYLILEFVKGGELFAKVSKGRFSEDLSRRYFQQLISAVGYCHSRGVFHRDLKPENLLVDETGNLKVSDFGLSAVRDQVRHDGMLHTLCGTPAYVAPEILTKKGYDGAKVDVWSCGIILFVLNAGYLPFNDPNLMELYRKIYKGEYRCPKWFSPSLKWFLSRLLETDPERRITIDEMLRDPWFKKGYKEVNFHEELEKQEEPKFKDLNAFDIISFSPSLDLSGLFDVSGNSLKDSLRIISSESPEKIVERVEAFAKDDDNHLRVKRKKEWGVHLEGLNGNFTITVEVNRLTDNLVLVEARRKGGDTWSFKDSWELNLRPRLFGMLRAQAGTTSQVPEIPDS